MHQEVFLTMFQPLEWVIIVPASLVCTDEYAEYDFAPDFAVLLVSAKEIEELQAYADLAASARVATDDFMAISFHTHATGFFRSSSLLEEFCLSDETIHLVHTVAEGDDVVAMPKLPFDLVRALNESESPDNGYVNVEAQTVNFYGGSSFHGHSLDVSGFVKHTPILARTERIPFSLLGLAA